jgi:hypothetical protein
MMKRLSLTIVALLSLCSIAVAQSGPPDATRWSGGQHSVILSAAPGSGGRIVPNPIECIPDSSKPVWSSTSTLLGYACIRAGANGR